MKSVAEILMGPVTQAIGWALVHFVWQGALLAMLLAVLLHTPGLRSPRLRYVFSFACLLAMVTFPLITGWVVYTPESISHNETPLDQANSNLAVAPTATTEHVTLESSGVGHLSSSALTSPSSPLRDFDPAAPPRHVVIADMLRWERIRARIAPYVPSGVFLWLLGVFALGWHNMASWVLAQRLRTHGVGPVPEWITAQMTTLRAQLGMRRAVECLQTTRLAVPATIGWLKPVVLLPVSSLIGLEASQLEAILAHELAHIRRHDYLANLFQILAETVLFYHPAVWWVSRRMRLERELCCDDMAIQLCTSPTEYAGALARVAQLQQQPTLAMTASGGDLLTRVRRLAKSPPKDATSNSGWVGLAVLLGAIVAVAAPNLTTLFAQPTEAPPGARSITFPEWTMGQLMVRPWGSDWQATWEPHQAAMGTVKIPAGMEVQLVVDNSAVVDLSPLSYLAAEDLQALNFQRTEVQDDQLAYIEGMQLRDLNFELTEITNEALQYFDDMTSLESLSVGRTNVTNAGVPDLAGLTELRHLDLNLTDVNDEGFSSLAGLTNLENLDLWDTRITDESLRLIGTFENLQILGLEETRISDAGMAFLVNLVNLEELNLETTAVGDRGVEILARLSALRRLNLKGSRITDEIIPTLLSQFNLTSLGLPGQIGPEMRELAEPIAGSNNRKRYPLRVHVQDKVSKRPISEARIEVKRDTEGGADYKPINMWTGDSGDSICYAFNADLSSVTVHAEGYTAVAQEWDFGQDLQLVVELERAADIGGMVVDEAGSPVEAASVLLNLPGERDYTYDTIVRHTETTATNGAWHCEHAPGNLSKISIELRHPSFVNTMYTSPDLSPARLKSGTERLVILKGIEITGVVVDAAGTPIVGASIAQMEIRRAGRSTTTNNSAQTKGEGTFVLSNQSIGPVTLKVNASGYLPRVEEVDFKANMQPLRFILKQGVLLNGRVVDAGGHPIDGVRVESPQDLAIGVTDHLNLSWKSVTNKEGRFSWDEAPEGEFTLSFSKRGYAPLQKELAATGEEIVVVMARPLLVTGRIFNADTGAPIRSAMVAIRQRISPSPILPRDLVRPVPLSIDSDGAYSLRMNNVAELSRFTRFQLIVQAPGYVDEETRWIKYDEEKPSIDLALKPEDPVTGFVVDGDGAPAFGALYAVATVSEPLQVENGELDPRDEERVGAVDNQGQFSVLKQKEPYLLIVTHEKGIARVLGDTLVDGVEIVLEPWARVEGFVKIGPNPAADVAVTLAVNPVLSNDEPNCLLLNTAQSNSDGHFVFERVGAGEAQLFRSLPLRDRAPSYAIVRPLYINAGESLTVDLGGTGRPVIGALSDGQDLKAQFGNLSKASGSLNRKIDVPWPEESNDWPSNQRRTWWETWVKTGAGAEIASGAYRFDFYLDEDGTFRVDDLIAGNYELSIQLKALERGKKGRELPTVATVSHEFEVPEMEGGHSKEPLDLGLLKVNFK